MRLLTNIKTCYKKAVICKSCSFYWFLSPSFGDHKYTFTCVLLSSIWKWNENRFVNNCFMWKEKALYCVNTKNNRKVDYAYNSNWCTAGYGNLIVGILPWFGKILHWIFSCEICLWWNIFVLFSVQWTKNITFLFHY